MADFRPKPKPISWEPNGVWDGVDGLWSSFSLRTGTPGQVSRVLPSTAGTATWVVNEVGCQLGPRSFSGCAESRGNIFHSNASKTWIGQGNYSYNIELNLGPKFNIGGPYGLDTVALAEGNATGGPSLDGQVVATVATVLYYTGMFGLNNQPNNLSTVDNPHPSYLTSLKTKNLIPSLSWAYTAGAWYRNGTFGALASLTLGGYDAERFTPNNVSFSLASDINRDLVVGLKSMKSTTSNGSSITLLSDPILTFIDSTVPRMIFPTKVANAIAKNFGLQYDPDFNMYFVSEKVHAGLSRVNPNITFTLGNSLNGGPSVDIVLPYSAFDLVANPPLVKEPAGYFPLQASDNETMFTLGRPFLQEAYLITNYEYQNFSISQTRFDNLNSNSTKKDIVALPAATEVTNKVGNIPIVPTVAPTPIPSSTLDKGGISHQARVGVIAGTTSAAAISLLILILFLWRWRKSRNADKSSTPRGKPQMVTTLQKQEMDGHGVSYKPRFAAVSYALDPRDQNSKEPPRYTDAELGSNEIYEVPGPDNPVFQELMTRPPRSWVPRGRDRKSRKNYLNYMNGRAGRGWVGDRGRGAEDSIPLPVSKFCKVPVNCLPSRGREREGMVNLNRALPPIPVWQTPAPTRLTSPLPNTRRVLREPVQ